MKKLFVGMLFVVLSGCSSSLNEMDDTPPTRAQTGTYYITADVSGITVDGNAHTETIAIHSNMQYLSAGSIDGSPEGQGGDFVRSVLSSSGNNRYTLVLHIEANPLDRERTQQIIVTGIAPGDTGDELAAEALITVTQTAGGEDQDEEVEDSDNDPEDDPEEEAL